MSKEYIGREEAILAVRHAWAKGLEPTQYIEQIPAADVTPVVRCKDCKHYDMGVCLKIYSDGNVHSAAWQSRRPEDFCSYGERKDKADAEG